MYGFVIKIEDAPAYRVAALPGIFNLNNACMMFSVCLT